MKQRLLFIVYHLILCAVANAQTLSSLEKQGQHVYLTGTTSKGEVIPAFLGESKSPIPSHLFACANCHGPDGKGVAEGGIKPSNITWHALTKPYGAISGNHRDRPPYNEKQILTALSQGKDPLGNVLEPSMPRYQLSAEDGKALIAYLKVIHQVQDTGVTNDSIVIGVILPKSEKFDVIRKSLSTYFDMVNQEGGIYRRSIQLVNLTLSDNSSEWSKEWEDFLKKESPFALLSPVMEGLDTKSTHSIITQYKTPVIAPLISQPLKLDIPNQHIFYFYPDIKTQYKTLLQYARELTPEKEAGILKTTTLAEVTRLKSTNTKTLLLSKNNTSEVIKLLSDIGWSPTLLLPSSFITHELNKYEGDIYIAYPSQSLEHPYHPQSLQKSAIIAADTLRTILLETGRKLTRKKVISLFEQFHHTETSWTGPLTFTPNRRTGAKGAYIKKFNPLADQWEAATPWVHLQKK